MKYCRWLRCSTCAYLHLPVHTSTQLCTPPPTCAYLYPPVHTSIHFSS